MLEDIYICIYFFFCDLAKSLNCVNHAVLVDKLHFVDFQGQVQAGSGTNR